LGLTEEECNDPHHMEVTRKIVNRTLLANLRGRYDSIAASLGDKCRFLGNPSYEVNLRSSFTLIHPFGLDENFVFNRGLFFRLRRN
jgi:hypothetical protein